ncbi:hypothetical protein HK097_006239, partial [Rhizophlyctis rosea]
RCGRKHKCLNCLSSHPSLDCPLVSDLYALKKVEIPHASVPAGTREPKLAPREPREIREWDRDKMLDSPFDDGRRVVEWQIRQEERREKEEAGRDGGVGVGGERKRGRSESLGGGAGGWKRLKGAIGRVDVDGGVAEGAEGMNEEGRKMLEEGEGTPVLAVRGVESDTTTTKPFHASPPSHHQHHHTKHIFPKSRPQTFQQEIHYRHHSQPQQRYTGSPRLHEEFGTPREPRPQQASLFEKPYGTPLMHQRVAPPAAGPYHEMHPQGGGGAGYYNGNGSAVPPRFQGRGGQWGGRGQWRF